MREGPLEKRFHERTEIVDDPYRFEFWDMHARLKSALPKKEAEFLWLCHRVRTHLAHFDPASADFITGLTRYWAENAHRFGQEWETEDTSVADADNRTVRILLTKAAFGD